MVDVLTVSRPRSAGPRRNTQRPARSSRRPHVFLTQGFDASAKHEGDIAPARAGVSKGHALYVSSRSKERAVRERRSYPRKQCGLQPNAVFRVLDTAECDSSRACSAARQFAFATFMCVQNVARNLNRSLQTAMPHRDLRPSGIACRKWPAILILTRRVPRSSSQKLLILSSRRRVDMECRCCARSIRPPGIAEQSWRCQFHLDS